MQHTFFLAFKKRGRGRGGLTVRATERQPSLVGGEVAIRVTAELPDVLFVRPLLTAKITVPIDKVSPATIDASITDNIASVVRQQLGLDMTITIGNPALSVVDGKVPESPRES